MKLTRSLAPLLFILTAFVSGGDLYSLLPKHYDLEELLLVDSVGIDLNDVGDISLTLAYTVPSQSAETAVITAEGKTFSDALSNLSSYAGRSVFLGHANSVIVGRTAAEKGLIGAFDYLIRSYETRLNAYVLTADGKAADVFSSTPASGTPLTSELDSLIKSLSDNSLAYPITLGEMIADFADPLRYSATPLIRPVKSEDGRTSVNTVIGSAVYKDDKLIGALDPKESFLLTLIKNRSSIFSTVCELPDMGTLSIRIFDSKTSLSFEEGDPLVCKVDTVIRVSVTESSQGGFDLATLDILSSALEEHYTAQVSEFLNNCKTKGEDICCITDSFRRFHPIMYSRWNEENGMEYKVSVKCNIENSFVHGD